MVQLFYNRMLDIIDYRNLRYQGQTQNQQPHGIGIAIDERHLFCLASWRQGLFNGPVFLVFPDSHIFCGRMNGKKLSGLGCFYLKDNVQVFVNYGATNENSFITVLPFCKVILEINTDKDERPKVIRHLTYSVGEDALQVELDKLFDKHYDFKQFGTWNNFVTYNLVTPNHKKLQIRRSREQNYQSLFIGLKPSGLGIKLINFDTEQNLSKHDAQTIIITAMGMFDESSQLNGLGTKISDINRYEQQQQGDYSQEGSFFIRYKRSERNEKAVKYYHNQLKLSINFKDAFMDMKYIYKLSLLYSKVNVQLVQQTQKIAQVIISNVNDSPVVLAQIENKRQRKRTLTPNQSHTNILDVTDVRQQSTNEIISNQTVNTIQKRSNISPVSLNEAQKSIYGSIQKIKKNKVGISVLNRSQNINAFKINDRKYDGDKSMSPWMQQKYQRKVSPIYQNSKHTDIYAKIPYQNNKYNSPFKPKYDISEEKQYQRPTVKKVIPEKSREKVKYLYQTILEDDSIDKLKDRIKSTPQKQPLIMNNRPIIEEQYKISKLVQQNKYKKQYEPNYKKQIVEAQSYKKPDNLQKLIYRREDPYSSSSNWTTKQQNQQLIDFFNKTIDQQNQSSIGQQAHINEPPSSSQFTLGNTPKRKRKKSPGKIRTIRRQPQPQQ